MSALKRIVSFSLFLFMMAALYGFLMRWYNAFGLPGFDYFRFLQAHSHVAFLGWGFVAASALHVLMFGDGCSGRRGVFVSLWIMLLSMALILITFPLYGYRGLTVVFLSLFVLASYVYSFCFLQCIRERGGLHYRFIRFSILLYLISTAAIWALAPIIILIGKNTTLYFNDIYFFLHFLYNGFFVFAISGIFFHVFGVREDYVWKFFYLNAIAVFPAYALSLLWKEVPLWVNGVGLGAAILQVAAAYWLVKGFSEAVSGLPSSHRLILGAGVLSYVLKVVIQLFSAFPFVVSAAVSLKPYLVIGYLHLITLGFMSTLLIYFLVNSGLVRRNFLFDAGFWSFFYSGALKVTILITFGLAVWWTGARFRYINQLLFWVTLFLYSGVLLMWMGTLVPAGEGGRLRGEVPSSPSESKR